MTQYTPGPWSVELCQHERVFGREAGVWAITERDGIELGRTTRLQSYDEATANARLMAAAPDLLVTCQWMLRLVEAMDQPTDPDFDRESVMLRAAIAKATS